MTQPPKPPISHIDGVSVETVDKLVAFARNALFEEANKNPYNPDSWKEARAVVTALLASGEVVLRKDMEEFGFFKDQVTEQLNEEKSGFWYACTGCYEGGECGGASHYYHDSEVFGCKMGSGCSECGGIGVRWDDTDYEDMAKFMLEEEKDAFTKPPLVDLMDNGE